MVPVAEDNAAVATATAVPVEVVAVPDDMDTVADWTVAMFAPVLDEELRLAVAAWLVLAVAVVDDPEVRAAVPL